MQPSNLLPYFNLSLTFFPVLQHLMVASPSAAHESVLIAIKEYLHSVFISLPVSASILKYHIHGNQPIEGPLIYAIPDLTVLELTGSSLEDRPLCFMESTFSQSDEAVMKKLRDYVCDHPDVLVVGKVLFKQAIPYQSPGVNGSLAPYLQSAELMTRTEWQGNLGVEDFASVVVDGHTWFSLATVEIHIWTREDGLIDIDELDGTGYAYGVCCFAFLLWLDCYSLSSIRHFIQPSILLVLKVLYTVASHFSRWRRLVWRPSKWMKRCTIVWKHECLPHSWTKNPSQPRL